MNLDNCRSLALAVGFALTAVSSHALTLADSANNCQNSILTPNATACAGTFAGNNLGASSPGAVEVLSFINSTWGPGFTEGITIDPVADASADAGFQLALGSALSGDFVLGLKQANGFSLYFYDNAVNVSQVTYFSNAGFGGNGRNLDISHATIYNGNVAAIPEPETYALMMAGLGAIGFVGRRRARQAAQR